MKAMPERVKEFIDNEIGNYNISIRFAEYLDLNNNKPVMRTFAYSKTKTYGFRVQEVFREYLDHNEENDCLYFGNMCGYRVIWKGTKKYNGYFAYHTPTYKFYRIKNKMWRPNLYAQRVQSNKEIQDIYSKFIPFFHISEDADIENCVEFARQYLKNPKVELLSKAGFDYLYHDKMLMKCNNSKMKQIARWLMQNKAYAVKHRVGYQFINMALKNGENAEQCAMRCQTMNDIKYMSSHNYTYTYEQMVELKKYLAKQNQDITIYRDYLNICEKLHRDMTDTSILFPRKLLEQHDCLQEKLSIELNKDLNIGLARKYKKFVKYASKLGNFKIVVPSNVADFVKWGNTLHNCVGSLGYDKKMAKGDCIIVGVFLKNKIVECCELNKKYEVVQLRGDHNGVSKHHKKATELVNMFIDNIKTKRTANSFC